MSLRLKNGRFAPITKARKERNPYFHRALLTAIAAFRKAGFTGKVTHPAINESVITLREPIYDYEVIIAIAENIETTQHKWMKEPKAALIYNVSFQDSRGRWFSVTHAWETVELASIEIRRRIAQLMEKYQRADSVDDEDEYAIIAVMVSVYKWRR